ncbi:MAG: hypothetical protein LBB20_01850, partial [Puniceicoccales bacterium]|nr:hypothetical protein [Puniceicoccales bacterium]
PAATVKPPVAPSTTPSQPVANPRPITIDIVKNFVSKCTYVNITNIECEELKECEKSINENKDGPQIFKATLKNNTEPFIIKSSNFSKGDSGFFGSTRIIDALNKPGNDMRNSADYKYPTKFGLLNKSNPNDIIIVKLYENIDNSDADLNPNYDTVLQFMPMAKGKPVSRILYNEGNNLSNESVDTLMKIGRKIGSAVGAMHKNEFNHGDLHLGNIYYDEVSDRISIIDFDTSRNDDIKSLFYGLFGDLEDNRNKNFNPTAFICGFLDEYSKINKPLKYEALFNSVGNTTFLFVTAIYICTHKFIAQPKFKKDSIEFYSKTGPDGKYPCFNASLAYKMLFKMDYNYGDKLDFFKKHNDANRNSVASAFYFGLQMVNAIEQRNLSIEKTIAILNSIAARTSATDINKSDVMAKLVSDFINLANN